MSAQEQKEIARFYVTHASYNGNDITEWAVNRKVFTVFYSNSYDSKKGTCKVQFLKIYKPQGVVSKLKLITEALDVTEYIGYMEGSIDFSNY